MNLLQLSPSEKRTLLAIFVQHWENARHIKNERLSFTNIYAIVSAGILSLLHSASGEFVLEISILAFLCSFSAIGLLMDAWWRAANYLSIGQIYLYDNPLLKKPLKLAHIKPRLLGHWGTRPGLCGP